jgi:hypothetical protein
MTPADVAEIIAMLKARWPRSAWGEDPLLEVKMWHMALAGVTLPQVQKVLPSIVQHSEFPPDPSEIRSAVFTASGKGPMPEAAWGQVQRWLSKDIEFVELPEPIKQAVRDIGGTYNVRNAEKPDNTRRSFIEAYKERRKEAMTGPDFAQMINDGFVAIGSGS